MNPDKTCTLKQYLKALHRLKNEYKLQNNQFFAIVKFYANPENHANDRGELAATAVKVWRAKLKEEHPLKKFHDAIKLKKVLKKTGDSNAKN